jgi:hypothetical protein
MNTPLELTSAEWKELMQLPVIRESWGLEEGETPEDFADMVYGVKFDFASGMAPGYVGDLYILHGDALGEPIVLIRKEGHLIVVSGD